MKKYLPYFILAFLFLSLNGFSQKFADQVNENGDINIIESKTFHAENAQILTRDILPLNPGMDPEGDYLSTVVFSNDGSLVFLANRMTNNISVFSWENMELVTNIEVGEYPNDLAITDGYLLVACQFADKLWVIDLSDYSVVDSLETSEQPCRIHVNSDGTEAYVACDIEDMCHVIDLQTMQVTRDISGFPVYLQTFSWSAQSSRNFIKYSNFVVSPDDQYLIISDGSDYINYFNILTGDVDHQISIPSGRAIALSGDGNRLVAVANPDGNAKAYQINLATATIETEVDITGFGIQTNDVVANMDGTKAFVGTNNNSSTVVNFDTQDFTNFSQTYTPFWMGVTHDHAYAVSGQNRFSIIDFENETMVDQLAGYNQDYGAVSPVNYQVFSHSPILYEGGYFFDFTDPSDIQLLGDIPAGEAPEGDAPYRVDYNSNSGLGVSVNNLSRNASIINAENATVESIIDLGEAGYDVKITPDGNWAVVGGYNDNKVKIIDLQNQELATTITTGQRPMEIAISPDGQYAYVENIKSNTLSMIELDGANSSLVTSASCGVIGVYTPFFGVRSDLEVSPDGSFVLVAASFDDQMTIFDTEQQEFIANIPVGDFPLSIAISEDANYVCVTNLFDHNINLLEMDGTDIISYETIDISGDYPVEVEYNPHDGYFYVITYWNSMIHKIDPATGEDVEQMSYSQYGTIFQIEFDETGNPLVLSQGDENIDPQLIYGNYSWSLSGTPAAFSYSAGDMYALVAIPGPDYVDIIDLSVIAGVEDEVVSDDMLRLYPNPAGDFLRIDAKEPVKKVEIYDMYGRKMINFKTGNKHVVLNVSSLPKGSYIVKTLHRGGTETQRTIVKK